MVMSILRPMLMAFQHAFKRTFTAKYPFKTVKPAEIYRGRLVLRNINDCIGCGLCSRICPTKAITIVQEAGRRVPSLDLGRCCMCGLCVEMCPRALALSFTRTYELCEYDKKNFIYPPRRLSQPPVEPPRMYVTVKDMDTKRLISHG